MTNYFLNLILAVVFLGGGGAKNYFRHRFSKTIGQQNIILLYVKPLVRADWRTVWHAHAS